MYNNSQVKSTKILNLNGNRLAIGQVDRIARYLDLIGKFLENASHLPKWAIAHPEDGFVTAAEMGELIKSFRPVEVTYAKDFSEVSGGLNTYIIVA